MDLARQGTHSNPQGVARRWLSWLVLLGVYVTVRGYHSFDGDQAYRLPLLLHRQDSALYADDPFVRSLDEFNPHRGSLALLDVICRPLGLSAGLFLVFGLSFLATCASVRSLARAVWPELGSAAGWLAVGLCLSAKAGNIGTNHLFEAMMLDRLVALSLGWVAVASSIVEPATSARRSAPAIALATIVHPSMGIQLAIVLSAGWIVWAWMGPLTSISGALAIRNVAALGLSVLPGMLVNLPQRASLLGDLPVPLYWVLSVELQNPQHMLPHLWRWPQCVSWCCYLMLAFLQLGRVFRERNSGDGALEVCRSSPDVTRPLIVRLAILLATIAFLLTLSWYSIESLHQIRVTIFQPFRMATLARGIALVLVAGRIVEHWREGTLLSRVRAATLTAGFLGDWLLIVSSGAELAATIAAWIAARASDDSIWSRLPGLSFAAAIAYGWFFLSRHDTESGHVPLLLAIAAGVLSVSGIVRHRFARVILDRFAASERRRLRALIAAAWLTPALALFAGWIPADHPASRHPIVRSLIDRCRFCPSPLDDVERLAVWCREHTPVSARFIGPPGPKTFRLWSRRSLAFNRSGSPYHAAGLADWFQRFSDHVGFHGSPEEFVHAYVGHRHELESRYLSMTEPELAALAERQGADHVIAAAPNVGQQGSSNARPGVLTLLHVEGRYAVYRVDSAPVVQRH